jgi:glycosyltransferase involved in cell wall biosynthesis
MPQPLNALFVDAADVSGGAQRSLLTLLEELPAHDIDVRLLAADQRPGGLLERATAAGIPASHIELQHWQKSLSGAFTAARQCVGGRKVLRRALEAHHTDVVIANGIHAGLFCAVALPKKTPLILHHRDVRAPLRALRGIAERAATVVAVSQYAAERTREQLSDDLHDTVAAVHNGVTVTLPPPAEIAAFRSHFGIANDAIVVAIVADFVEWKNQRAFIDAMREVSAALPQAVGLLVGGSRDAAGGRLEAELKGLCTDLPIIFTGTLPSADPAYAASLIVVSAAADEPFGRTVIEALAHGCKVVAVGGSGPEEVLAGCDAAVIVDQPKDLATAILGVVAAGLQPAVNGADGKTHASRFSPTAHAEKIADIIREAARG